MSRRLGTTNSISGGETTLPSAATTDLKTALNRYVAITGSTTITSFGTGQNLEYLIRFTGSLTLTYNATSLILPGLANIITANGDTCIVTSDSSGNWLVRNYQRADGTAFAPLGAATASTPAVNDSSTRVATTAYYTGQGATATPLMDGVGTIGTSALFARQDHIHPADTSKAPLASPTFTGTSTFAAMQVNGSANFASRPTFNGATPWDSNNFNPANYLPVANPAATGSLQISNSASAVPLRFYNSAAGTDAKFFDINQDATSLSFRLVNDAYSAANYIMAFTRSGTTLTGIQFAIRPTFNNATPWDSANFNPALYAPLASPTFTGTVTLPAVAVNATLGFGSRTGQFINLYATTYAIGVQSGTTYIRTGSDFAIHLGGTHSDNAADPGTGGTNLLRLNNALFTYMGNTIYHSGNFNPANYAALSGASFTGGVLVRSGSNGSINLAPSGDAHTGYVEFFNNASVRQGYIGFGDGGNLLITAEVGNWNFTKRPTFAGNTPWDSANFNPANYATLASPTFTGGFARFYTDNGQIKLGPNGGPTANDWMLNAFSDGSLYFQTYNASGTFVANAMQLSRAGALGIAGLTVSGGGSFGVRPTFAGNTPWDSGNFNPGLYAPLASPTFSGTPKIGSYAIPYVIAYSITGTTGYRQWSDGFIEQWGVASVSDTFVTFPLAFPNACRSVVATVQYYDGANAFVVTIDSPEKTRFGAHCRQISSGGALSLQTLTIQYRACGY